MARTAPRRVLLDSENNYVIVSRKRAKELGLTHYYTGIPCAHGHYEERMVSTSMCAACNRRRVERYRIANRGKRDWEPNKEYHAELKVKTAELRRIAKEAHLERSRKRLASDRALQPFPKWFCIPGKPLRKNKVCNPDREQAWIAGDRNYSGKPCSACGDTLRRVSNDRCSRCENRRALIRHRRGREESTPQMRCFSSARARMRVVSLLAKAEFLGIDFGGFTHHIESQFRDGMTWDNYGTFWELDHIIPICAFDMNSEMDVKKCAHYTNVRPLTVEENYRKRLTSDVDYLNTRKLYIL